jgi:hypothetical protein
MNNNHQAVTPSVPVYAMHWNNISPVVLQGQRDVFISLGVDLRQELADQQSHGAWMNDVLARHGSSDIVIFCDIDAFPLSRHAYELAVHEASKGNVFGLAQFSNHKSGAHLYAGPMFMAFRKSTWEALGSPDLNRSKAHDAAELLSVVARSNGVLLKLSMPSSCLIPKWALADQGVFGIATFYGQCDFFHLFESRHAAYEQLFELVVSDVVARRPLNFVQYLKIAAQIVASPTPERRRNWVPKPLRRWFARRIA